MKTRFGPARCCCVACRSEIYLTACGSTSGAPSHVFQNHAAGVLVEVFDDPERTVLLGSSVTEVYPSPNWGRGPDFQASPGKTFYYRATHPSPRWAVYEFERAVSSCGQRDDPRVRALTPAEGYHCHSVCVDGDLVPLPTELHYSDSLGLDLTLRHGDYIPPTGFSHTNVWFAYGKFDWPDAPDIFYKCPPADDVPCLVIFNGVNLLFRHRRVGAHDCPVGPGSAAGGTENDGNFLVAPPAVASCPPAFSATYSFVLANLASNRLQVTATVTE